MLSLQAKKLGLEKESAPGEDAMKTVKMTTKDLGYYLNLVGFENSAGFEKIDHF